MVLADSAVLYDVTKDLVQFLETHEAVAEVKTEEHGPCSLADIERWEMRNMPCRLPPDLRAFLMVSNGLVIRWSASVIAGTVPVPVGVFHVNRLAEMDATEDGPPLPGGPYRTVWLDSERGVGLVYELGGTGEPQVWFRDVAGVWHFLAPGFTPYFRLMQVHMGIARWHYAFTPAGLDPVTKHWMAFFCPERLTLDLEWRRVQAKAQPSPAPSYPLAAGEERLASVPFVRPKKYARLSLDKVAQALKKAPEPAPSKKQPGSTAREDTKRPRTEASRVKGGKVNTVRTSRGEGK